MGRDEFEQRFIEYRKYLREEVLRFHDHVAVYRQLQGRSDDPTDSMNFAPAFFAVVQDALFTSIVLWADKLFDEKGERGLFNFLTFVEHDRKWLTVEELQRRRAYPNGHWVLKTRTSIAFATVEADRKRIRDLAVVGSFRLRRDKFHGHFDKDYFFDRQRFAAEAPIRWSELDEAAGVMGDVVNFYSVAFDATSYGWETANIDDLGVLLRHADRGFRSQRDE